MIIVYQYGYILCIYARSRVLYRSGRRNAVSPVDLAYKQVDRTACRRRRFASGQLCCTHTCELSHARRTGRGGGDSFISRGPVGRIRDFQGQFCRNSYLHTIIIIILYRYARVRVIFILQVPIREFFFFYSYYSRACVPVENRLPSPPTWTDTVIELRNFTIVASRAHRCRRVQSYIIYRSTLVHRLSGKYRNKCVYIFIVSFSIIIIIYTGTKLHQVSVEWNFKCILYLSCFRKKKTYIFWVGGKL